MLIYVRILDSLVRLFPTLLPLPSSPGPPLQSSSIVLLRDQLQIDLIRKEVVEDKNSAHDG